MVKTEVNKIKSHRDALAVDHFDKGPSNESVVEVIKKVEVSVDEDGVRKEKVIYDKVAPGFKFEGLRWQDFSIDSLANSGAIANAKFTTVTRNAMIESDEFNCKFENADMSQAVEEKNIEE